MHGRGTLWRAVLLLTSGVACSNSVAPSPAGAASANEPAGLPVLTDGGFDQPPPAEGDVPIPGSPGWSVVFGLPPGPLQGSMQLVSDPTAPSSPPSVYDFVYPEGMVEGEAPGTAYFPRSPGGL